MSLIDRASTTGEIHSHIKNLLISAIYQQLLYLFQVFTGFALAGKRLLVFGLYELVLGREDGETEAGKAELSHRCAVPGKGCDNGHGFRPQMQLSGYIFHLTGVFLPSSVVSNK